MPLTTPSSTPSPSKRSILSPKPSTSNINNSLSPSKRKHTSPTVSLLKSPTRKFQLSNKNSPSPRKKLASNKLNFTIWKDKTDKSNAPEILGATNSNDLNHNDQENILQPKKLINTSDTRVQNGSRVVLGDLSINEFQGFLINNNGSSTPLNELYHPINFNNEFKSLHKYSDIPNYCTPINKNKYMVRSNVRDNDFDDDEMESFLIKKSSCHISNTANIIRKHKRSMSVGKNETKLNLVRKNNFTILSN